MGPISLLFIEDDPLDAELILARLKKGGVEIGRLDRADRASAVDRVMGSCKHDVIISDYSLPDIDGRQILEIARSRCPDVPFIFVSGAFGEDIAIEMLQNGATDYVLKTRLERLVPSVKRALSEGDLRRQRRKAEDDLAKKVDELARANEELTRSNMELERFAYVSSHDLQEPLRKISSYVQLLAERYREQMDDVGRRHVDIVLDSVVRMHTLIRDLLSYSRLKNEETRQTVDLNATVESVIRDLEPRISEESAYVENLGLPTLTGNPSQMYQLLQNLIGNAIKYHGETPAHVQVSSRRTDGGWQISISDNGIGIDPEHHARIFTIFQRLHARHRYSGNGIGLAICKKIVESHGGRIWVDSSLGQGAVFSFWLPSHS